MEQSNVIRKLLLHNLLVSLSDNNFIMQVWTSIMSCLRNHDRGDMEDPCLNFFKSNDLLLYFINVLKHDHEIFRVEMRGESNDPLNPFEDKLDIFHFQ